MAFLLECERYVMPQIILRYVAYFVCLLMVELLFDVSKAHAMLEEEIVGCEVVTN